jgi:hypothetical protein
MVANLAFGDFVDFVARCDQVWGRDMRKVYSHIGIEVAPARRSILVVPHAALASLVADVADGLRVGSTGCAPAAVCAPVGRHQQRGLLTAGHLAARRGCRGCRVESCYLLLFSTECVCVATFFVHHVRAKPLVLQYVCWAETFYPVCKKSSRSPLIGLTAARCAVALHGKALRRWRFDTC